VERDAQVGEAPRITATTTRRGLGQARAVERNQPERSSATAWVMAAQRARMVRGLRSTDSRSRRVG
jgi:hypothetical protein